MPIDTRVIRTLPLFADLDEAAVERVGALATEVELPAGALLIERGKPGSGLFVLLDGSVEVELPARTVRLDQGEFVGELSLLTDRDRSARVRAATHVRCLALARSDFDELLEAEPRIAVPLLHTLARRLADAQ